MGPHLKRFIELMGPWIQSWGKPSPSVPSESRRSNGRARSMLASSGRQPLSAGSELERLIRKAAKSLREYQVATMWKIPNDLRITGSGLATYADEQPADFIGHTTTGRVIMVEAKQHKGDRLPLYSKGGITPYQWTSLLECHKAGGIALIVWQRGDEVATLDMDMVQALATDRRSIAWKKIQKSFCHPATTDTAHLTIFEPHLKIMSY